MSDSGSTRRPRQADVARRAGVSQATVSLVLGGSGTSLSAATRQRVFDAAREIGFVPNPAARRLAARSNQLLGVSTFTPTFPVDVHDSYYPFLVGVEEQAAELGYDLLLFTGMEAASRTDGLSRLRLADGCVLLGRHAPAEDLTPLVDGGFPLVYIGRNPSHGSRLSYVGADYVKASEEVVGRLIAAGHRSLVYVRESDDAPASQDRQHGLSNAVENAGVRARIVRTDGFDLNALLLRSWISDGATAIVVESTDTQAAIRAVREALASAGVRAPRDVSLALLGDEGNTSAGAPLISGFAPPRREMGRRAAEVLVDLISDPAGEPHHELLDCAVIEGETIGPPPTGTARSSQKGSL